MYDVFYVFFNDPSKYFISTWKKRPTKWNEEKKKLYFKKQPNIIMRVNSVKIKSLAYFSIYLKGNQYLSQFARQRS